MSSIGGFARFVIFIGFYISNLFSKRLFMNELLGKLFFVKKADDRYVEVKEKREKRKSIMKLTSDMMNKVSKTKFCN